jgi:hypothetical protein
MDRLKAIPLAIIETRWSFEKQKPASKKGKSQPNNFGWIFYFLPGRVLEIVGISQALIVFPV